MTGLLDNRHRDGNIYNIEKMECAECHEPYSLSFNCDNFSIPNYFQILQNKPDNDQYRSAVLFCGPKCCSKWYLHHKSEIWDRK